MMALGRDGAGQVHRVTRGDYMGRNHGQVDSITAERIDLTEIVPAGDGGWVERPRTVELSQ
jgi:type IV pilus assembly protein PilP